MVTLQSWSFAKVLLVSGAWILLSIVVAVAWIVIRLGNFSAGSGSGGIGAVSFGINGLVLAIPVLPPLILLVLWSIARWR